MKLIRIALPRTWELQIGIQSAARCKHIEGRIKDLHIVNFECDVKMKPSIIDTNEETVNLS